MCSSDLIVAPLIKIPSDAKQGDVLFQLQIDPYENSLRHAGTHLLVSELTKEGVWSALEEGRTFVAFDWLADSKGFDVAVVGTDDQRHEIGTRTAWIEGEKLQGQSPLEAHWKVVREGEVVHEADGDRLDWKIPSAGIYRVELWLEVLDQPHCWILTSPFYLGPIR